jgi:hypothetical protein
LVDELLEFRASLRSLASLAVALLELPTRLLGAFTLALELREFIVNRQPPY